MKRTALTVVCLQQDESCFLGYVPTKEELELERKFRPCVTIVELGIHGLHRLQRTGMSTRYRTISTRTVARREGSGFRSKPLRLLRPSRLAYSCSPSSTTTGSSSASGTTCRSRVWKRTCPLPYVRHENVVHVKAPFQHVPDPLASSPPPSPLPLSPPSPPSPLSSFLFFLHHLHLLLLSCAPQRVGTLLHTRAHRHAESYSRRRQRQPAPST